MAQAPFRSESAKMRLTRTFFATMMITTRHHGRGRSRTA